MPSAVTPYAPFRPSLEEFYDRQITNVMECQSFFLLKLAIAVRLAGAGEKEEALKEIGKADYVLDAAFQLLAGSFSDDYHERNFRDAVFKLAERSKDRVFEKTAAMIRSETRPAASFDVSVGDGNAYIYKNIIHAGLEVLAPIARWLQNDYVCFYDELAYHRDVNIGQHTPVDTERLFTVGLRLPSETILDEIRLPHEINDADPGEAIYAALSQMAAENKEPVPFPELLEKLDRANRSGLLISKYESILQRIEGDNLELMADAIGNLTEKPSQYVRVEYGGAMANDTKSYPYPAPFSGNAFKISNADEAVLEKSARVSAILRKRGKFALSAIIDQAVCHCPAGPGKDEKIIQPARERSYSYEQLMALAGRRASDGVGQTFVPAFKDDNEYSTALTPPPCEDPLFEGILCETMALISMVKAHTKNRNRHRPGTFSYMLPVLAMHGCLNLPSFATRDSYQRLTKVHYGSLAPLPDLQNPINWGKAVEEGQKNKTKKTFVPLFKPEKYEQSLMVIRNVILDLLFTSGVFYSKDESDEPKVHEFLNTGDGRTIFQSDDQQHMRVVREMKTIFASKDAPGEMAYRTFDLLLMIEKTFAEIARDGGYPALADEVEKTLSSRLMQKEELFYEALKYAAKTVGFVSDGFAIYPASLLDSPEIELPIVPMDTRNIDIAFLDSKEDAWAGRMLDIINSGRALPTFGSHLLSEMIRGLEVRFDISNNNGLPVGIQDFDGAFY